MCGRYTLITGANTLQTEFNLAEAPQNLAPRYNIAPTQPAAVVVIHEGRRRLEAFHWGLIPFWAKEKSIGQKMINARAETLAQKPAFKNPLNRQRCLVLADGFFEWQTTPQGKQPMYIRLKNGNPFAFAGLWDQWKSPSGEIIYSCAIVTTTPNELMAPIHNRMPVILPGPARQTWLEPAIQQPQNLLPLLTPYPAEEMLCYPVSKLVNSPANDRAECIAPL